ncbi:hypothetical protein BV898_17305 [Hypsibius exemplaris]|uniref:Uncharacterized protein n=1 Tax=Hypsibius exemplaris TaxID=2072580 RepID=A0A9X6RLW7_HYPEX|nr:hypothetical protein BV898_17305 [Hypsibius exemplaris]
MAETTRESFWRSPGRKHCVASAYPGAYHRTCPKQQARQNSTRRCEWRWRSFAASSRPRQLFAVLPRLLISPSSSLPATCALTDHSGRPLDRDEGVGPAVRRRMTRDGNDRIILDGHSKGVETFGVLYTGESALSHPSDFLAVPKVSEKVLQLFCATPRWEDDESWLSRTILHLNTDNAIDLFLLAAGEKDDALSKASVGLFREAANKKAVMAHDKYQALKTDHPELCQSLLEQIIAVWGLGKEAKSNDQLSLLLTIFLFLGGDNRRLAQFHIQAPRTVSNEVLTHFTLRHRANC